MTGVPAHEAPTMAAVARQAGVSVASVSRVLNDEAGVGAEVRARIEAVIREIDYVPNASARSLRSRATRQLSLVVDDIGNPAYVEIMRALQEVARQHDHRLLVQSTDGRVEEELEILQDLGQRYVDGLVFTSTRFSPQLTRQLISPAVPVVVIGSLPDDVHVDAVGADARGGARDAARHLVDEGCSRLAMINGPAETLPAQSRRRGFLEGSAESDIATEPAVLHAGFTAEAGYAAALELFEGPHRPDGLLCANDQLAVGAIEACTDRDIDVPGELAVVGMDNTRDGTVCRPTLSSVDLQFADRGRIAGQLLLDRIQERYTGSARRVRVPAALVVRGSSQRRNVT